MSDEEFDANKLTEEEINEAIDDVMDDVLFEEAEQFPIITGGKILGSGTVTEEDGMIKLELALDKREFLKMCMTENGIQTFLQNMLKPEDPTPNEN